MNHITITDSGQILLARIAAGEVTAAFTRIGVSDAEYTEDELEHLPALKNICRQADILNVEVKDDAAIVISSYVDNRESEEGFYVSAVGIFAKVQGEDEVLYGITVVEGRPFLPANSVTLTGISFRFTLRVGNSRNITINVDETASLTLGEFQAYRRQLEERLLKAEFPAFEDYTSAGNSVPATETAIAEIVTGKSVYSLFQYMKAALLGLYSENLELTGKMEKYCPFVTMFQNIPISERKEDKWYLLVADTKGIPLHYYSQYIWMAESIPLDEREELVLYGNETDDKSSLDPFEKPAVMRMLDFEQLDSREISGDSVREQDIFYLYETEER